MFQIDIAEHVRLSYESLEAACEAHANAAATLAMTGIAAATTALAVDGGRGLQLAAAIAAAAAFGVCAAYVGFNHQPRIYGHRVSAARLWVICEQYRGLMAEMRDGAIDLAAARDRRAVLLDHAAGIFEHTAPDDRFTFEIARRALGGRAGPVPAAATAGEP